MEDEKTFETISEESISEDDSNGLAARARNRTVMLTPEITGEVRARIAQDLSADPLEQAPASNGSAASSYSPAEEYQTPNVQESAAVEAPPAQTPVTQHAQPITLTEEVPIMSDEQVVWTKKSAVIGFLVSFDSDPNGSVFELRAGRLIVTSEGSGNGNFLIIDDETVSPMHAIMRITEDGSIQVLDQLSEYGTKIMRFASNAVEELSGEKSVLVHGDVIMFGERSFSVCTIVRRAEEASTEEE